MRVHTHTISDGQSDHEVVTHVDIVMDNGDTIRIREERPAASVCRLALSTAGAISASLLIRPRSVNIVEIEVTR